MFDVVIIDPHKEKRTIPMITILSYSVGGQTRFNDNISGVAVLNMRSINEFSFDHSFGKLNDEDDDDQGQVNALSTVEQRQLFSI